MNTSETRLKKYSDYDKLAKKIAERDASIAKNKKRIKELEARLKKASVKPKAKLKPRAKTASKKKDGKPAFLLKKAPPKRDDLKEISGVGPVMQRTLNKLGIYQFKQVANLSAADVRWVSENIDTFPDRIKRDKWVSQAKKLYRKKYGKKA